MRYNALLLILGIGIFFVPYWLLILRAKNRVSPKPKLPSVALGRFYSQDPRRILLFFTAIVFALQGFGLFRVISFQRILMFIGAPNNIFLIALGVIVFSLVWIPIFTFVSWLLGWKMGRFEKYRLAIKKQIGYFSGALCCAYCLLLLDIVLKGTLVGGELSDQNQVLTFFVVGYCFVLAWEF
jgi:hypothetical protein